MIPTVPSPFFAATPQWWVSQVIDEPSFHCKLMKPRWKRRFHGEAKAISLVIPFKKPYSLNQAKIVWMKLMSSFIVDLKPHSDEEQSGVRSIFGSPTELHVSFNLWTSHHNIHVHQEILCILLLFICFLWVLRPLNQLFKSTHALLCFDTAGFELYNLLRPASPVAVSSWNILEPSAVQMSTASSHVSSVNIS